MFVLVTCKIWSKIKACRVYTIFSGALRRVNQELIIIWLKSKPIRDFLPALVTCKFDQNWRRYCVHNIFSNISLWENFSTLKVSNSKANIPIWPEIELIRVFKPVLVTCKFHKDPIKNEDAIMSMTFFPALKGT